MSQFELTETQRKIIELLGQDERTLTEITDRLEISKSGALKQLDKLVDSNLISKKIETTEIGRESIYSLNNFTYFFSLNPESDSIIQVKTTSAFRLPFLLLEQVEQEKFKNEIKELFKRLEEPPFTILYGSVAKGEGTWKSDIDLMFLKESWSKKEKESINDIISEVNMEIDHQITSKFRTFSSFKKGNSLVEEIKDSGMIIYDDLYERSKIWQRMKKYKSITN